MPINRAFWRLKKPRKDGFQVKSYTIYSRYAKQYTQYIVVANTIIIKQGGNEV